MDQKKKILIVEDDVYLRDIYESLLKDEGFQVDTAVDGQEGIIKAQQSRYNLILLDIMMPRMNGIEFLKELKKKPLKNPPGAIILLTNLAQDPVINEGLSLGARAYLVKSDLDPQQFIKKIQSFLKD